MKIRTVIHLLFSLSLLMVSVGVGSAQLEPLYPYNVTFTLDSALVTYDFHQTTITPDTIRGSIQDNSQLGSYNIMVNIKSAMQWIIRATINGNAVQDGTTIGISQGGILPVEIIVIPYPDGPDTESYCLTLSLSPTYKLAEQCIALHITNSKSAVSSDLPIPYVTLEPNPAGSYIFVRGLDNMQSGYRYEIFSITGTEIRHGLLPDDARIKVQDLNSGAYRLLVSDAKRTLSNIAFTVLH